MVNACRSYKQRARFFDAKIDKHRTFGKGLPADVSEALASKDAATRLRAMHKLVSGWVRHRFDHCATNADEKASLQKELDAGRKKGMQMLEQWHKDGKLDIYAPSYGEVKECAACNGAVMKPFAK